MGMTVNDFRGRKRDRRYPTRWRWRRYRLPMMSAKPSAGYYEIPAAMPLRKLKVIADRGARRRCRRIHEAFDSQECILAPLQTADGTNTKTRKKAGQG